MPAAGGGLPVADASELLAGPVAAVELTLVDVPGLPAAGAERVVAAAALLVVAPAVPEEATKAGARTK